MTSRDYDHKEFDDIYDLKQEIIGLIAIQQPGNYTRLDWLLTSIEYAKKRIGPDGVAYILIDKKRYPASALYGLQSFASKARTAAQTHDIRELSQML